jgi:hypothetical protein
MTITYKEPHPVFANLKASVFDNFDYAVKVAKGIVKYNSVEEVVITSIDGTNACTIVSDAEEMVETRNKYMEEALADPCYMEDK